VPPAAITRALCGALLEALSGPARRRAALCSALLGTALCGDVLRRPDLSSLFAPAAAPPAGADAAAALPLQEQQAQEQGPLPPLRAFVQGALAASLRSLGLRVVLALRLAPLAAAAPGALVWFGPELRQLLIGYAPGQGIVSYEASPDDLVRGRGGPGLAGRGGQ
jgi:hypothetical protein